MKLKPVNDKIAVKQIKKKEDEIKVEIDFEGIQNRIISLPIPERRYQQIGFSQNKIFYSLDFNFFIIKIWKIYTKIIKKNILFP